MARFRFTPKVLSEVRHRVATGQPAKGIAAAIGCSYESLRTTCQRYRISLRGPGFRGGRRFDPLPASARRREADPDQAVGRGEGATRDRGRRPGRAPVGIVRRADRDRRHRPNHRRGARRSLGYSSFRARSISALRRFQRATSAVERGYPFTPAPAQTAPVHAPKRRKIPSRVTRSPRALRPRPAASTMIERET
jgi:hypothetical protein